VLLPDDQYVVPKNGRSNCNSFVDTTTAVAPPIDGGGSLSVSPQWPVGVYFLSADSVSSWASGIAPRAAHAMDVPKPA
jgi:hypothetical protein